MVTIDWVKRIVGVMGSLGNLVWASLLQNRRHIHHSGDGVGAVCEAMAIQRRSIWCAGLSYLARSSNHTDETDRRSQMHQLPARAAKFRMSQLFLPLTLILFLVRNFTNSLQAGKMGAYLHASTYVSPTLLLTFLFPRRGP